MKTGRIVLLSLVVVLVGATLLKAVDDDGGVDPTATTTNAGPRGLLALARLVQASGMRVVVRRTFDDPLPPGDLTVIVPPPEQTGWTQEEARVLLARVESGGALVVLCDDEGPRNERLKALLEMLGATCSPWAIADAPAFDATGLLPAFDRHLRVRGLGRVQEDLATPWLHAWRTGHEPLVLVRRLRDGAVTLVGSASLLSNDGIGLVDNAAFLMDRIALGSTVVVDERHHGSRSRAALVAANARGLGPRVSLAALVLLMVGSLLSLLPRPGDAPAPTLPKPPTARAQATAWAALALRAQRPRPPG